jgi:threonine synthase
MSDPILYYSTNLNAGKVRFKDALLKGLAPDKGLFMPEQLPTLTPDEISSYRGMPYYETAFRVARKFLHTELPDHDLKKLVQEAYNFEVPLEKVYDRKYIMRLDQGPTASFKDFAARMMGRLMQYFLSKEKRGILILTATSGDTGSAIANAFYGLDNIKVVVLFPEKEVTDRQRKQMTTLHKNIQIVAVDGKFDDCQALVKTAFSDPGLKKIPLSSANSINIGRLIPQSIYYVYAFSQLFTGAGDQVIFSVPSGNFGNLMGGLLAMKMGLPVKKFVVSTNENDEVPVYFDSGNYNLIIPSINCISSAMNVGHPSNMARIIALYGGVMNEKGEISTAPDMDKMKKDMYAVSINDRDTKQMIRVAYDQHRLLLEPHGSVAWYGLQRYLEAAQGNNSATDLYVSLETAHPAKFPNEISEILKIDPALPPSLEGLDALEEQYDYLSSDYEDFKKYLLQRYG